MPQAMYAPIAHLPDEIRLAFKAARVRPVLGECYRTAARLVIEQSAVPLLYVEGWASREGHSVAHAWVRHPRLGDVDLLLKPGVRGVIYEAVSVLTPGKVAAMMRKRDHWGPWSDLRGKTVGPVMPRPRPLRPAARDFAGVISFCNSQDVAAEIVRLADQMTDAELWAILEDEWVRCDAHREYRAELVRLFHRAGYVSDNKHALKGSLVIFRGDLGGEGVPRGISWTRSLKVARKFAAYCVGPRAMYLGIYKEWGVPTVWRAKVEASEVLGYFTERNEEEIVVDPATLREVKLFERRSLKAT